MMRAGNSSSSTAPAIGRQRQRSSDDDHLWTPSRQVITKRLVVSNADDALFGDPVHRFLTHQGPGGFKWVSILN
jgi:hypothetical protein